MPNAPFLLLLMHTQGRAGGERTCVVHDVGGQIQNAGAPPVSAHADLYVPHHISIAGGFQGLFCRCHLSQKAIMSASTASSPSHLRLRPSAVTRIGCVLRGLTKCAAHCQSSWAIVLQLPALPPDHHIVDPRPKIKVQIRQVIRLDAADAKILPARPVSAVAQPPPVHSPHE